MVCGCLLLEHMWIRGSSLLSTPWFQLHKYSFKCILSLWTIALILLFLTASIGPLFNYFHLPVFPSARFSSLFFVFNWPLSNKYSRLHGTTGRNRQLLVSLHPTCFYSTVTGTQWCKIGKNCLIEQWHVHWSHPPPLLFYRGRKKRHLLTAKRCDFTFEWPLCQLHSNADFVDRHRRRLCVVFIRVTGLFRGHQRARKANATVATRDLFARQMSGTSQPNIETKTPPENSV